MSNIIKYDFQGHDVRIVQFGKEDWWIAKDVCDVLEHSNYRMAVDSLDPDEKGVSIVDTPGGPQEMLTITEAGLYKLILRSRKPQAKAFSRWVTHEVLPQIRKTGVYMAAGTVDAAMTEAIALSVSTAIQSMFVGQMVALTTKVSELQDMVNNRPLTDNCIGNRGAKLVSASLLEYARLMSDGDKKKARSIRGMAEVTLRADLNYNGTGRIWSLFPSSRWAELQAKLGELYRAGKRCAASQQPLPTVT